MTSPLTQEHHTAPSTTHHQHHEPFLIHPQAPQFKKPLTGESLIRKMQQHPTLTAVVLGMVFAVAAAAAAAYLAVDLAT